MLLNDADYFFSSAKFIADNAFIHQLKIPVLINHLFPRATLRTIIVGKLLTPQCWVSSDAKNSLFGFNM